MESLHHFRARFSDSSIHFKFTKEPFGDSLKGIWWPLREPIDCGTVYNGWEISDSVSQRGTNWGEAKNNMEEFLAPLKEVREQFLWRSVRASFFIFSWCSYKLTDICFLVCRENIWNILFSTTTSQINLCLLCFSISLLSI
jgi:hypothetical protein